MAVQDYNSVVQAIYVSYFGRPADTFGYASFKAQLDGLRADIARRAASPGDRLAGGRDRAGSRHPDSRSA